MPESLHPGCCNTRLQNNFSAASSVENSDHHVRYGSGIPNSVASSFARISACHSKARTDTAGACIETACTSSRSSRTQLYGSDAAHASNASQSASGGASRPAMLGTIPYRKECIFRGSQDLCAAHASMTAFLVFSIGILYLCCYFDRRCLCVFVAFLFGSAATISVGLSVCADLIRSCSRSSLLRVLSLSMKS